MKTKENREYGGGCYCNFDHTFEHGLEKTAEMIKENKDKHFDHSAYNFIGHVWFENGKFYEEIWRNCAHIDTFESENLGDLIKEAILIGGGE